MVAAQEQVAAAKAAGRGAWGGPGHGAARGGQTRIGMTT